MKNSCLILLLSIPSVLPAMNTGMEPGEVNRNILRIIKSENPRKAERVKLEQLLVGLPQDAHNKEYMQIYENLLKQDIEHLTVESIEHSGHNGTLIAKGVKEGFGALVLTNAAYEHFNADDLNQFTNRTDKCADYATLNWGWFSLACLPSGYVNELARGCNGGIRFLTGASCLAAAGYLAYKSYNDINKGRVYNHHITTELNKKKALLNILAKHKQPLKPQLQSPSAPSIYPTDYLTPLISDQQ